MQVAVLVKQVPVVEQLALGSDGRLRRTDVDLEMNAYCRRAVSQGVALAQAVGGRCVVLTLGPPAAADVLREAIACGADEGVLVSDPALAGSDTLATARALAAALRRTGRFDLILTGRNSVDADTGQVGPQVAQLLDLPFAGGVRQLQVDGGRVRARCELDDGWRQVEVTLPAVLSVAERLIEPCKAPPERRQAVPAHRIRRLAAADLGAGPWGQAGSPTLVGSVRVMDVARRRLVLHGAPAEQATQAVQLLRSWGVTLPALAGAGGVGGSALPPGAVGAPVEADGGGPGRAAPAPLAARPVAGSVSAGGDPAGRLVAVVAEPGRPAVTAELAGEAAVVARAVGGRVAVVGPAGAVAAPAGAWGEDLAVVIDGLGPGPAAEEDVAAPLAAWCRRRQPWAVLAPGTLWGREVASRVAADLGAGLTGDAVELGVDGGRLVAWKPAFGGRLLAAVTSRSPVQLVTVRPGVLPRRHREPAAADVEQVPASPLGRVTVLDEGRDDDVALLLAAPRVVCVGQGVDPERYDELLPLLQALGAELAGTRKVTDRGWLPRARQVGITGHSVAPALFVSVGASGRFNHMVGARGAGVVVAVNRDRDAAVFDWADLGLVGDWAAVATALAAALTELAAAGGGAVAEPGAGRSLSAER